MQIFWFSFSGSMLHAMFSGRFDSKPAEDGSYFIDRDGTHFRYILNYLLFKEWTLILIQLIDLNYLPGIEKAAQCKEKWKLHIVD